MWKIVLFHDLSDDQKCSYSKAAASVSTGLDLPTSLGISTLQSQYTIFSFSGFILSDTSHRKLTLSFGTPLLPYTPILVPPANPHLPYKLSRLYSIILALYRITGIFQSVNLVIMRVLSCISLDAFTNHTR